MDIENKPLFKSKLFTVTILQGKDELEEKLEKCHMFVVNLVTGLSDREIHDALNQAVCKGAKEHEEISLGLLYTILTEPINASKAYRDLSFIAREGFSIVINKLLQILNEKFQKFLEAPRVQLLWIIGEMMKNQLPNLEALIVILMRQIAGGDVSSQNIWLVENVLKLMVANRPWLEKNPPSLQLVIFTFLRTIEDHDAPKFKVLRQNEVEFCVSLIRDKFQDVMPIGRDLIRLLQNVFRIPEFTKLWKDMLHRPQSLCQQFTGLPQILKIRTSRRLLSSRITPDMESKLGFLALKVKFGNQRRYQDWFYKQYLSSTESQTLLPDLVRFLCGVIHPPNEILGSEVIPRWAILGWLYTVCQNPVSQSNTKLALFFDWLFFAGDKDNIMNIEPAMLLMHNSVRTHANITYSLLDFICRMSTNYCTKYANLTKQGLYHSFKNLLDKRVVSSLSAIIKNPRMDREMKVLISETMSSFVSADKLGSVSEDSSKNDSPPLSPSDSTKDFNLSIDHPPSTRSTSPVPPSIIIEPADESSTDEAVFSDEDDEDKHIPPPPPPPLPANDNVADKKVAPPPPVPSTSSFRPITIKEEDFETKTDEGFAGDDITELDEFQNLDSNLLKDNVLKLKNISDDSTRSEAMEAIISNIESMGDFDDEIASPLCVCLANCLSDDLSLPVFSTNNINQKLIETSLEKPQYVIFRTICSLSKNDINRENLYVLINGIHELEQKIGYHFLYFLKACYNDEEKYSLYEDYISFFKDRTLKTVLIQDLKVCYEYDPILFMYLIESIFKRFKETAVGNKEVVKMLAATIHPDEMNLMISKVLLGELTIIGENQVGSLLEASLNWSAFEQSCLWQLIDAEETPIEMLVGILPHLKAKKHSETLSHLLLQVRAESPGVEIIKPVLCMDINEGPSKNFSLCLFKTWCREEARELALLLAQLLSKPSTNTNKRKSNSNLTRHNPTREQVLLHLNHYYKHCQDCNDMSLFRYEALRYAVTQTKKNIIDTDIKAKCKPLFSEFNELPDRASRKRKNQRSTQRNSGRGGGRVRKDESSDESDSNDDEDSNDDSDDGVEEVTPSSTTSKQRQPTKKRRKPSKALSSDEDDD